MSKDDVQRSGKESFDLLVVDILPSASLPTRSQYDPEVKILYVKFLGNRPISTNSSLTISDVTFDITSSGAIAGIEVLWPKESWSVDQQIAWTPVREVGQLCFPNVKQHEVWDLDARFLTNPEKTVLNIVLTQNQAVSRVTVGRQVLADLDENRRLVGLWIQVPES